MSVYEKLYYNEKILVPLKLVLLPRFRGKKFIHLYRIITLYILN